ncbi:ATP-binding protein [Arthrobacter castelli]|uniref:ATP-binding protein n=1 Tax=Arthrobacter castelli TaxID=271431 RepID=UPI0004264C57|nr:AAA family ATPase [Arthrobacter castelli]
MDTSLSSFVGHTRDMAAIIDQLRQVRLLTLTGAGGVGKTRLAAAVATSLSQEYGDGTWLCELAPIREAAAVEESLLTALGIKQQQGATVMQSLLNVLRGRRLLLILDNCEHVIDTVSHLAQAIVSSCPAVTVLATSRQPLNIEGEQRWPVEPLSVVAPGGAEAPDGAAGHKPAAAAEPAAAVRLFRDRAASADPAFDGSSAEAIAEICERLDGVPLAIELAAARVPALGTDELRRRLDDRFRLLTAGPRTDPRHRSLSAVVDWSYDLLSDEEQIVFSRLSVFAGSFTLDAAEQVCCSGSIERGSVAVLVAGLVDASMLVRDRTGTAGDRLRLLETLRQYAAERLAAHGDTDLLRHRFAEYYAGLAETAEPQIRGPDEAAWVSRLDDELDNLRAAHQHAIGADDVELALRLPAALHYYAFFRLRDEVHGWAEASLALTGDRWHRLLAQVQGAAAERAGHHGDLHRAIGLAERGLAAARDPLSKIRPLETLAVVALYEGRLDDCFGYAREALEVTVPAHEHYNTAFAYLHQVLSCIYGGDRPAARRLMSKVQEAAELCGNPTHLAWTAYCRGELLSAEDADAALARFEDAVAIADTVRNSFTAGVARVSIGTLRSRHGDTGDALRSFHEVIEHWYRVNDWVHQWTTLRNLIDLFARLEANLDAAVLYGAVVHPRTGATAFGADQERMSAVASSLRKAIGDDDFEAAVARGGQLSDDQAVGYALHGIERALQG